MAELTVVGCGTVVPEGDRAASSFHYRSASTGLLIDCGPGAVQALARLELPWGDLTDLAITHFHADHVGALPGLFFALTHGLATRRTTPLEVWGPVGTESLFRILAEALGEFMLDPGFPVRFREVAPGDRVRLGGGETLSVHKTPHTDESLAYRVDGSSGSFGYSGDTGPSETLGPFMRGVDVFVCECSLRDEEVGTNHLSPTSAAAIASAASPGALVVTHIYPHVRAAVPIGELIEAAGYRGRVVLAHEGLALPLGEAAD
ncbi:MAG: ribonuclease Z [Gemmatimonadota bacterium]|nr:ribonuclease Z [Gemmatimonadota bacterium]